MITEFPLMTALEHEEDSVLPNERRWMGKEKISA